MPHPRLQVEIELGTPEIASDIRSRIETQVSPRPKFRDRVETLSADGNVVRLDVRFLQRSDRAAVDQWLRSQIVDHPQFADSVRAVRMTEHLCTHDDETPTPCNESEFRVILERGINQADREESSRRVPRS